MNKKFQIMNISRNLKKRGVDPDLIDLHSEVDSSLNFNENFNMINDKFMQNSPGQLLGKRMKSIDLVQQAQDIDAMRKPKAIMMDMMQNAATSFDSNSLTKKQFNMWKKKPNRYDINGVDNGRYNGFF